MNSPRFTRFTPAHQPGDVFVRTDAVISVAEFDYLFGPPLHATSIGTVGNGHVYVKESPAQVIEALSASDDDGLVSIEITVPDGDASSLADDCECNCGTTCCDDEPDAADYALALKEAQEDAKIADERAEWYKKLAEDRLAMRDAAARDVVAAHIERDHYARMADAHLKRNDAIRAERDQLIAKLKDTTAALAKASAELGQRR